MNPTAALLEPEIRELVEEGRYSELRDVLKELPNADVADILAELAPEKAALAFRFLPHDDAAETYSYLHRDKQEEIIEKLGNEVSVGIIENMSPDDRAKLIDELPHDCAQRIVASLSPATRATTQAILGYPPKSVGRLMTPDYVAVRPGWTIAQTLQHIRTHGRDAETLNVIYVVDAAGKLIDDIRARQLLLSDLSTPIDTLMNQSYYWLTADQPQSEAVEMMRRYDRTALPVVDSRGHLIGIVTHDDVADVAEEQTTEGIHKLGGVSALEEPFMSASVFSLFKKRAPWLGLLFMSELLTSNAIAFFETEIQRAAILAIFIPAIISSGGNSGSQASTLVIRALGLKEIDLADWWRIFKRECGVALMLGLMVGSLGFIRISIWGRLGLFHDPAVADHYAILGVTIAVTLIGVVIWGSIMGAMLPLIMKKLKFDPASSSTPLVATLVDVTGIVIYFTCAMLLLKSTLLRPDVDDTAIHSFATVEVVSVDGYEEGDKNVDLTVQTPAQKQAGKLSRVSVPVKGFVDRPLPQGGEVLKLEFASQSAVGPAAREP